MNLKRSCLTVICWILASTQSFAATTSNLIFPYIPPQLSSATQDIDKITGISTSSNNVVFIGSKFCFAISSDSKLNQVVNSDQASNLKIKITDSSNNNFESIPEIIKPETAGTLILIKAEEISTIASEGNGTIDITLNGESLVQEPIYISSTLASRLNIPLTLSTKVNNVTLLNRIRKGNLNKVTIFIGGDNFYKKALYFGDTALLESRGLTFASILPKNEFTSTTSRILKGNEVLILKSYLKKKSFENDILILIASPFGLEVKSVSIPKCDGKICGEN